MRLPASLLLLALATVSWAQPKSRTFKTDTGTVVIHYFISGQPSTKEWTDKDERWGRSWAYAKNGEVLFVGQTRRFAGHASAHFSYHGNGAVSKIEVSDAPDAGIQWYRSTTTYDELGNRTGFWEQGHDDDGIIPNPSTTTRRHQTEPVPPPQAQVAIEQRLFVTEVFVVNTSRYTCRLDVVAKHPSPAMQNSNHTMAPGDTVRVGMYSTGEIYEEAAKHLSISAKRWSRKQKKQVAYRILREEMTAAVPEARKYYLFIGR
jgi:hypothetical protein